MQPVAVPVQAVLLALVLTAAVYDSRFRRIPNWLVLAGWVTGFVLHSVLGGWAGFKLAAGGFGLAFGIYFVLYLLHFQFAGDVKLMGAVGTLLGAQNWFVVFIFTALAGGLLALIVVLSAGRLRRTLWNVGYIIRELLSFRAPYMHRDEVDVRSEKSLKLPHAVSIAAGTIAFLVYLRWTV